MDLRQLKVFYKDFFPTKKQKIQEISKKFLRPEKFLVKFQYRSFYFSDLAEFMADEPGASSNPLRDAANCLRSVMFLRAPNLIQDRLYLQQVYESCMVGLEMVNWLMDIGQRLVHNRQQAVGMWQAMLEDGHIMHGKILDGLEGLAKRIS